MCTAGTVYVNGISPASPGALKETAEFCCFLFCKHRTPPNDSLVYCLVEELFGSKLIILFSSEDPPEGNLMGIT